MFLIQVQTKTSDAFHSNESSEEEKLNECLVGLCFTKVKSESIHLNHDS